MGGLDFGKAENAVLVFAIFSGSLLLGRILLHLLSHGTGQLLYPSIEEKKDFNKERLLNKIKEFIDDQNYDAAEIELKSLIKKYPKDKIISDKLINLYRQINRYEDVIDEKKRFLITAKLSDAEKSTIYNRIADIYIEKLNNPDGAIFALKQMIEDMPYTKEAQLAQDRIDNIEKNIK